MLKLGLLMGMLGFSVQAAAAEAEAVRPNFEKPIGTIILGGTLESAVGSRPTTKQRFNLLNPRYRADRNTDQA